MSSPAHGCAIRLRRDLTEYQIDTVKKFLKCSDLKQGFGIVRCPKYFNLILSYLIFKAIKQLLDPPKLKKRKKRKIDSNKT